MKQSHMHRFNRPRGPARVLAAAAALLLLFSACGQPDGVAATTLQAGKKPPAADAPGKGPHTAAPITPTSKSVVESGWLQLYLDDASKTVAVGGYVDKEWYTLPQIASTPLANAGACAVEADIVVNGHRLTLNSQDHAVAYGSAKARLIKDRGGSVQGVQVNYLLTPDAQTAAKEKFSKSDVAFLIYVRYTLQDGNFYVEADWNNASGNANAFIESIGLMERFGALRSPGPEDFLLLPDGGGALLYPARAEAKPAFSQTADLRFAVYGDDPSNPLRENNSDALLCRDSEGNALSAHVAAYGACRGHGAFVAVIEKGASLVAITAKQSIPGEAGVRQSAVGPRFTITPTAVGEDGTIYRALRSYGGAGKDDDAGPLPLRICYRFFSGSSDEKNPLAMFNSMAMACREQLINMADSGVLSSTKTVRSASSGLLPLHLTLLGAAPDEKQRTRVLTTFDQATDILARLKTRGVDSVNIRYLNALRGGWRQAEPEQLSPLWRLGGKKGLADLQAFCKAKGLSLFLDARILPTRKRALQALDIEGNSLGNPLGRPLALRGIEGVKKSVRALLGRLSPLETAGVSLADAGGVLYADYAGEGLSREQALEQLGKCLPSLSAQWAVMLDTGFFHAVRYADVLANLPLAPQLRASGGGSPRYMAVPLLPMVLHGSLDYSGQAINLLEDEQDRKQAFLRGVAYGACPALVWSATSRGEGDPLYFDPQMEDALTYYTRANAALGDLRTDRITAYSYDAENKVATATYSNNVMICVNFGAKEVKAAGNIQVPPGDFVRIG